MIEKLTFLLASINKLSKRHGVSYQADFETITLRRYLRNELMYSKTFKKLEHMEAAMRNAKLFLREFK